MELAWGHAGHPNPVGAATQSIRLFASRTSVDPLRAVWITAAGGIDTAVMLPTDPVLAVLGLIGYASSTTLTALDQLAVVELTPALSMWTSTEIAGHPSLCATQVAAALGHRNIVHGTAVFTGRLDVAKNPTSLTGAQARHLRDLAG
jgi:hypothetical protein